MIHIIYGSQTGTAEGVARELWKSLILSGFQTHIMEGNDYQSLHPQNSLNILLFVVSTTGNGQIPDNFVKFMSFARESDFSSQILKYSILGLGDSGYQYFNQAAKQLNQLLSSKGCVSLLEPSYADDRHDLGPEFEIDRWIKKILCIIPKILDVSSNPLSSWPGRFSIDDNCDPNGFDQDKYTEFPVENISKCVVEKNERVTHPDHFQAVHHITLKFEDPILQHFPEDVEKVLVVKPFNGSVYVKKFISMFSFSHQFSLAIKIRLQFPQFDTLPRKLSGVVTFVDVCKWYLDFMAVPQRSFFKNLLQFTPDDTERAKLEMSVLQSLSESNVDGYNEYLEYCYRPKRTILEVLEEFPETVKNLSVADVLNLIGEIKCRKYSICSCSDDPSVVELLVAKVSHKSIIKRPRIGLCSNLLCQIPKGYTFNVRLERGNIRFPSDPRVPLIAIGPGTGCASFISRLYQIRHIKPFIHHLVFLGFRYSSKDYLLKTQWNYLASIPDFCKLTVAFSRDGPKKHYVQHEILNYSEVVANLIYDYHAVVVISGRSENMPKEVQKSIKQCLSMFPRHQVDVDEFMEELIKNDRIIIETW